MKQPGNAPAPTLAGVVAAFAAVYFIWGSTYLAILFAIETMPPFLMAGARFLVAGLLLYGFCRLRGAERPTASHWRSATITGFLLLVAGNGAVVWAELRISSGLAALLVSTVPFWMVLFDWAHPQGKRPTIATALGLLLGFLGIGLLIGPSDLGTGGPIDRMGCLAVLFGAMSWAAGSLLSRTKKQPSSPLLSTALRMICGGVSLLALGFGLGEASEVNLSTITLRSWFALAYLTTFGSIVAFSCYIWLLRVTTPAKVGTYAYVNPVVAVFLGWALASEEVTSRIFWAAMIIVFAVMLITGASRKKRAQKPEAKFTLPPRKCPSRPAQ